MPSGLEHYRTAESYAAQADGLFDEWVTACDESGTTSAEVIRGQVEHCREMGALHATLAVAAATALTGAVAAGILDEAPDLGKWIKAAGVKPS